MPLIVWRIGDGVVAAAFLMGSVGLAVEGYPEANILLGSAACGAMLVGSGAAAEAVVAGMLLQEGSRRARAYALLLLGAFSLFLLWQAADEGWAADCSCMSLLRDMPLGWAAARNGAMMLYMLLAWRHSLRA